MKTICLLTCLLMPVWLVAGDPTLVYLVRHAEKVDESRDADLSPAGMARAVALSRFFEKIEFDLLVASQYQRTQKTLGPLAAAKDMTVETIPAGEPRILIERIRALEGGTILVAGHSNTVPDLIKALGGGTTAIDDSDYDNLYLVILSEASVTVQNFRFYP
jgi:broad specificity phosphatase PhoE